MRGMPKCRCYVYIEAVFIFVSGPFDWLLISPPPPPENQKRKSDSQPHPMVLLRSLGVQTKYTIVQHSEGPLAGIVFVLRFQYAVDRMEMYPVHYLRHCTRMKRG